MARRTVRPAPVRTSATRPKRRDTRTAAILVSALVLAAVVATLAWTAWGAFNEHRLTAAAWRRVGRCAPLGQSNAVECTGVHLVVLTLPRGVAACVNPSTCEAKVNVEAMPAFQGALSATVQAGLGGAITQFQTVNRRRCRDARNGAWIATCVSKHSYGIAVDFRTVDDNRHWETVTDRDERIMEVVSIFQRYGFRWGGNFTTNFDPQHLEWIPGSRIPK
jgi:D-alanyl-D-alanine carboxypeptidase